MRALYLSLSLLFVLVFALACSSKPSTPSTTTPIPSPSAAAAAAANALTPTPSVLSVCVSLANVRSGPGTTFTVTKQLSQGTVITPTQKSGEWYFIGKDDSQNDNYIHESVVCSASDSSPSGTPASTSVSASCPTGCTEQPSGCQIKGNISYKTGEKVYYMPGDPDYDKTIIDPDYGERWFCTEAEAQANGWKRVAH
jgi:hypothetical protein